MEMTAASLSLLDATEELAHLVMENLTSQHASPNATSIGPSLDPQLVVHTMNSINFDMNASLMANFISDQEPVLRLVYLILLSLATGMGNLLVLVAVLKFPSLRRPTNAMLGSLALSDFLVGTITVPLYTAWTARPGIFDRSAVMCGLVLLSCLMVVTASQVSLLLLSVEQFLAVCHPFRHRNLLIGCPRLHTLGILFAWASSVLTAAVSLLAYNKKPAVACNYYSVFDETFLFVASICGVFFPFALIIYFNVRVLCAVRENEKKMTFAYRRDDYRPILRKKGRVGRDSFSFSSYKTDGSLYDPKNRSSLYKDIGNDVEMYDSGKNYSKGATDKTEAFDFVDTLDHVINPDLIKPVKFVELFNDIHRGHTKDTMSGSFHENLPENFMWPRRCQSRTAVLDEIQCHTQTHHGEYKRLHSNSRNNKQSNYLRRINSSSDLKETLEPFGQHSRRDMWRSIQSLAFCGDSALKDQLFVCQNHQSKSQNCVNIPNDFAQNDSKNYVCSEKNTLNHTTAVDTRIPSSLHSGTLFDFCEAKFTSPPKLMNYLGFAYCSHVKILGCSGQMLESPSYVYEAAKESTLHSMVKGKRCGTDFFSPQTLPNKFERPYSLSTTKIPTKIPMTCSENQNTKSLYGCSFPYNAQNGVSSARIPGHAIQIRETSNNTPADKTTMVELRAGNMKSRDVRGNQCRRNCYNEKPDSHFGTDFLNTFQGIPVRSKSETCVDGLEHAVCTRSEVINNKLINTIFGIDDSTTKRELEHETILDELPVVIDKNDNETSVDSGISINLTNFEDIKDAEDTKFIHPRAKTILDERRKFDDGENVREKSVGCLPVPSASESFRQLRLRKRSRSLSISSVGISRKVRWMVALVCATFILAWFPFFAVILVNMFCDSCALNYFLNAAIMVAFSKSMANPVVYALCHVEFRRAYGKVFKACGCKPCC